MPNFNLADRDVKWTLAAVHWHQALWMIGAGLLLIASPPRRFGNAYEFVFSIPGGQLILGGIYLTVGLSLIYAIGTSHQKGMARGLFVGGALSMVFAAFLLAGTIGGPTGVVGWFFAVYLGAHMLLQSALLTKK